MTTDTLFHSTTYSPDGTSNDLNAVFTPGAGELWYADKLRVISDGTGGQNVDIAASGGVRASDTSAASNFASSAHYIAFQTGVVQDDKTIQTQKALGVYVTENDAVRLVDNEITATSANITVGVTLRRVL